MQRWEGKLRLVEKSMRDQNIYCQLAKQAIKNYLESGNAPAVPSDLPKHFYTKKCGVFVTIKKGDELRGCIGTYLPAKENIAREIIDNAVAAAIHDNRFDPVELHELNHLTFEVSLLDEPEQILDLENHNPEKYGLIVKSADFPYKTGLLLPNLEGVDTSEKQFLICCQKAGINPAKENVEMYRFTVEKYQE
jgi:AmmeMemoRadiSam system protein A